MAVRAVGDVIPVFAGEDGGGGEGVGLGGSVFVGAEVYRVVVYTGIAEEVGFGFSFDVCIVSLVDGLGVFGEGVVAGLGGGEEGFA